jgi:hypothetical protein
MIRRDAPTSIISAGHLLAPSWMSRIAKMQLSINRQSMAIGPSDDMTALYLSALRVAGVSLL